MEQRVQHTYATYLYEFVHEVLVVCPQCAGKALVKAGNFQEMPHLVEGIRVVCGTCGYNKTLQPVSLRDKKHLIFGAPVDPFFHLPVWLRSDFGGETLWAYNLRHVAFLEEHMGAKLRERHNTPRRVRSIGARLPRWMTSRSNRAAVLKALGKLKEM